MTKPEMTQQEFELMFLKLSPEQQVQLVYGFLQAAKKDPLLAEPQAPLLNVTLEELRKVQADPKQGTEGLTEYLELAARKGEAPADGGKRFMAFVESALKTPPPPAPKSEGIPMPLLIGAAALVLILLMRRK